MFQERAIPKGVGLWTMPSRTHPGASRLSVAVAQRKGTYGEGTAGPIILIYVSESREAVHSHIGVTPANFAAVAAEAAGAEVS